MNKHKSRLVAQTILRMIEPFRIAPAYKGLSRAEQTALILWDLQAVPFFKDALKDAIKAELKK